ncbi:MAG: hypothetical protein AAGI07_18250 [Bacteroidota bacterium]
MKIIPNLLVRFILLMLFFSFQTPHDYIEKVSLTDSVKSDILSEIKIEEGSGEFLIEGGKGHKDKFIKVYYHKPKNFHSQSKILIVIPGAGRNGDSYRDAWIDEAEKYGVLVLSPMYSEKEYGFEDYHLCGLVYDMDLRDKVTYIENSNEVLLNEENLTFKVKSNADEWIFNDFGRLFESVVDVTKSKQVDYDIFGHSAGGQILHRFVLFYPNSKANRILASNSGFYTLPDFNSALPFGMKNAPLEEANLKFSFKKKLILFNGELDNENEKGGTLLRSTSADKQGLHRLERGKFFYKEAKSKAMELGFKFNWELEIIPDVGHNHREMGDAAAKYLYERNE